MGGSKGRGVRSQKKKGKKKDKGASSDSMPTKRKWSNLMPLLVAIVVVGEIVFLGRLDIAKNLDVVNSWTDSFYSAPASKEFAVGGDV